MKNGIISKSILLLFFILITGCASIPSEAPELSSELGERIEKLEEANLKLLRRFFEQKRKDIDSFIEYEWLPEFSQHFFSNSKISKAWNTIVIENNVHQRTKFLITVGTKLQQKINDKRTQLVAPLNELEKEIEYKLKSEYEQAKAINNSLTSFLTSASKVADNRNRLLAKVGVTEEKISKVIDKTDDIVSKFLSKAKVAEDKINLADEYIDKIKGLRNSL